MSNNDKIQEQLLRLAMNHSRSFCYSCYRTVPSGQCVTCGSDDVMRELPGVGVEYGLSWIVRELLRENLTPANTLESFEQSVADCYPEAVKIGWIEYDMASAIKELDPVSWNMAHSEYTDSEVEAGNLMTFDNGSTYYWRHDIERFVTSQGDVLADP